MFATLINNGNLPIQTSTMKKLLFLSLIIFSLHVKSQYTVVDVSTNFHPVEPSIAMDTKNPNRLIAGANLNKIFMSADSGKTWMEDEVYSSLGVWGDPVMMVDTAGDFYFFHLSNPVNGKWIDRIVCQKSIDNGVTWSDGSFVGLNGTKQQDKHWVICDRSNNYIYMTWTEFDRYGSANPLDKTRIMFTKSTDAGMTWSTPIILSSDEGDCVDSDNTVEGAIPALGPNGEIYVSWSGPNGIVFNKSLDQGNTWLTNEILIADQPGGWDYEISGLGRCNGLPYTVCDTSNSSTRGNIYVQWTDQRNGLTDTDVWIIKSTNGGDNWTLPKRVNDDNAGNQQFLTSLTIDQTTGFLYSVFYDRRNLSGVETDVYLAYSNDGGESFTNTKISNSPFEPNPNMFFGDYTDIVADHGIVRPIWVRMHNDVNSVHTALIEFDPNTGIQGVEKEPSFVLEQNFPNPATDYTQIAFKIRRNSVVSITVYDIYGRLIANPIINEEFNYGRHIITLGSNQHFVPGVYYYRLSSDTESITKKMIFK